MCRRWLLRGGILCPIRICFIPFVGIAIRGLARSIFYACVIGRVSFMLVCAIVVFFLMNCGGPMFIGSSFRIVLCRAVNVLTVRLVPSSVSIFRDTLAVMAFRIFVVRDGIVRRTTIMTVDYNILWFCVVCHLWLSVLGQIVVFGLLG